MERALSALAKERAPKINAYIDSNTEAYHVKPKLWKAAGMKGDGGCLCIGCLELRLGRRSTPKDFPEHPLSKMPGTRRLMERRGEPEWYRHMQTHPLGARRGG
jgi:hypothetical protein